MATPVHVFDRLLGLDPVDWVARSKELDRKADAEGAASRRGAEARHKSGTRPSHAPSGYTGTFEVGAAHHGGRLSDIQMHGDSGDETNSGKSINKQGR